MPTSTVSLFDWILNLFRDPAAREAFQADPERYAAEHGFADLSASDVHDALCLGADSDDHVHLPPPRDYHDGESAPRYLERYVDHYTVVEKHTTNIDNSIHQTIDTDGGDFDQDIDIDSVVASGDGAVAAGDDIEDSTITTGNHNVIGDNNISGHGNTSISGDGNAAVIGDGNTTSFGDGDASSTDIDGDVNVDDGSSFAVGGSSSVDNSNYADNDTSIDASDHSTNDSGNTTTDWHDESDNSQHTSYDDHSSYDNYEDSSASTTHTDNSATTTDSHESYSAEVV